MKVKFSHEFYDHNNNKVTLNGGDKAANLKTISVDALMYPGSDEKMNGQEKCRRHDLGVKIMNFGDEAEIGAEDIVILKKVIGDRYIPCVVAQSFAVLEGKDAPKYAPPLKAVADEAVPEKSLN